MSSMEKGVETAVLWAAAIALVLVVAAAAFFVGGAVLYVCWNYGAVVAFGATPIGYWPACFVAAMIHFVGQAFQRSGSR